MKAVLDTSAALAWFLDEPGGDVVGDFIGALSLSTVTQHEILKALLERGLTIEQADEVVASFNADILDHRADDARAAAQLFAETRQFGSGLGDRTCLALAIKLGQPVLTADRNWAKLNLEGLEVKLVRGG